jgi:hypothetical protein
MRQRADYIPPWNMWILFYSEQVWRKKHLHHAPTRRLYSTVEYVGSCSTRNQFGARLSCMRQRADYIPPWNMWVAVLLGTSLAQEASASCANKLTDLNLVLHYLGAIAPNLCISASRMVPVGWEGHPGEACGRE